MSTVNKSSNSWFREKVFLGLSFPKYLKVASTPFNIIASLIMLAGLIVGIIRFTKGLGYTTNLTDEYPWGLWIGFDLLCGVALAAGGFMIASAVHLFGLKEYRPILRPAILTGFLGYFFVVVALLFDLGQPWRLPYPMIASYGVASVMFLVAWHVALYLTVQFLEFSPAIFEWLNMKAARRWILRIMVGVCIAGVILSMLHQSALGALFLLAPLKVHPLWYSSLIPIFFFVSAIAAGLSMVIFESMLSHRFFKHQVEGENAYDINTITIGLGKACSVVLIAYFFLKWIGVAHSNNWELLATPYGYWFLVEIFGFVLLPAILFGIGVRSKRVALVRFAAILTVLGIIVNRLNVSVIAYKWDEPIGYYPSWSEVILTIAIITAGVVTYKWIVSRMPVLYKHSEYPEHE
ncbi:MAG: polysulfide reductase NrfD [Bacteroidetes bacterium]|jgi:Ni/Fe-hydrogenase subunit HybB-like protein|nr:polysulfide reductase NrfD [Bacteroidota bacterium]MBT6687058.1 polysulfide reductase NrfD [Bacteroidota bacterium]MBT7142839.1 polysulfide reductase NrfD [Bacteroidota bacterium]MBT7492631.1 polysulfide reductase NrfD [Bacteroidota bacterium]